MTKKQCLNQIKEMLKKDGTKAILVESERLLNSGGIDVSREDLATSYAAAKCILSVSLVNISYQYKPPSHSDKWIKKIRNLHKF